jgi:tRNA(Ile)-lysidine synthase
VNERDVPPGVSDGRDVDSDVVRVVAVAASGGRDSIALLFAALRAARELGLHVVALHVHHGLLAEADGWAKGLEEQCAAWAREGWPVTFACARLADSPARGESVEAWARMAQAAGASLVLLGHHRRDQAETVLLQALRGAGPAGLSAMPRLAMRGGMAWGRPWLAQPSEAIDHFVALHGLHGVTDPSNTDPRFARSRLRTFVMPALRDAFPAAEASLAAVARRAQEARCVLEEVADDDLRRVGAGDRLPLEAWRALSPARRANALRRWLAGRLSQPPADALVQRVLAQSVDDTARRWPIDGAHLLRSWRGSLSVVAGQRSSTLPPQPSPVGGVRAALSLTRCDRFQVPGWSGLLEVFETSREGLAPSRVARVFADSRHGGERFQRRLDAPSRSLKQSFQSAGVPTEDRLGPLLFDPDGALLFVPGLGVDARAWEDAGTLQWGLRWSAS